MQTSHPFSGGYSEPPALPQSLTGDRLLRCVWWGQRRALLWGMCAGVIWMGALAAVPVALGRAIDDGIRPRQWSAFAWWMGMLTLLYAIHAGTWTIRHRYALGIYERSLAWLHRIVADRVLDPRGGIDGVLDPGDVVSLTSVDCRRASGLMDISCRGAGSVVTFIAVLTAMVTFHWQLALAVLLGLMPLLAVLFRLLHLLERRTFAQQETLSAASAIAADVISALRVVKGVGAEESVRQRYAMQAGGIMSAAQATATVRASTLGLDLAMSGSVIAIIAWLGGRLVLAGTLTVGQLVMFSGWSVFLIVPLLTFNELGRKWAMGRAAARRIVSALTIPYADENLGSTTANGVVARGVLAFDGVVLGAAHPRAAERTVEGVSFIAAPGTIVALVASGGITDTLTDLLIRTRRPDAGVITLDGADIQTLDLQSLRAAVLVAEHDAVLFKGSLRRNLTVATDTADDHHLTEALAVASALDIVQALAGGLDGPVSERGRSLSGGQRQRVALARALLADAPVMVLSDPTSALDAFTESDIVDRLRAARTGRTTIVMTTSPALLEIADEVLAIGDDGAVSCRGTHEQLMRVDVAYRGRFAVADTADLQQAQP